MFLLGSSRGSVIAIMLSVFVFIAYSPFKNKLQFIILAIIATPIVIWAVEVSGSGVFSRFSDASKDGGGGRMNLWSNSINHFFENILIGGRIEIGGIYPHNFILEILMSTGILGFLLIAPLFFKVIPKSYGLSKNNLFILLIYIQGISMHFFSGSLYTATLIFLPMGLIFNFKKERNDAIL